MKRELYIYGSENPKMQSKAHIADENGNVLCGRKFYWGEVTACIDKAVPDDPIYKNRYSLMVSSFGGGNQSVSLSAAWEYAACKNCSKHLKQILTDHYI